MPGPITNITQQQRDNDLALAAMILDASARKHRNRPPVADEAALKAITAPIEAEDRKMLVGGEYLTYVYSAAYTDPSIVPDDGSAGGWKCTTPKSTPDTWQPSFDYVAGDSFVFTIDTDMQDASGDAVSAGALWVGEYVDANGDPVATTSGTELNAAELAKMNVSSNQALGDQNIAQADIDGLAGL